MELVSQPTSRDTLSVFRRIPAVPSSRDGDDEYGGYRLRCGCDRASGHGVCHQSSVYCHALYYYHRDVAWFAQNPLGYEDGCDHAKPPIYKVRDLAAVSVHLRGFDFPAASTRDCSESG